MSTSASSAGRKYREQRWLAFRLIGWMRRADPIGRHDEAPHERNGRRFVVQRLRAWVGVCMATSGSGAIDLLNGLSDAAMDHQPLVAIVGQQAGTALGADSQQEVDLVFLFKDVQTTSSRCAQHPSASCYDRGVSDPAASAADLDPLLACLRGRSIAVLTGAGISTESGIPDYRGPGTRARAKDPMRFAEYTADGVGRARYWVRAMVGWPSFAAARPNAGHLALADLEARGLVRGIVTQNVDRLHHAAGSRRIVELHGALHEVRCLDCGSIEPRPQVQRRLGELNPHVHTAVAELRPDGDADLPAHWIEGFRVPACLACGGTIKPDVVFFGESVPAAVVEQAHALVAECEALLVVGSSLAVFSGYRFVRRAHERGMPVAIVNLGDTRGDPYATVRIDAAAGDLLPRLRDRL